MCFSGKGGPVLRKIGSFQEKIIINEKQMKHIEKLAYVDRIPEGLQRKIMFSTRKSIWL